MQGRKGPTNGPVPTEPAAAIPPVASSTLVPGARPRRYQFLVCFFEVLPYRWRPKPVTWDSSRTVVVIKLRRTSALIFVRDSRSIF